MFSSSDSLQLQRPAPLPGCVKLRIAKGDIQDDGSDVKNRRGCSPDGFGPNRSATSGEATGLGQQQPEDTPATFKSQDLARNQWAGAA